MRSGGVAGQGVTCGTPVVLKEKECIGYARGKCIKRRTLLAVLPITAGRQVTEISCQKAVGISVACRSPTTKNAFDAGSVFDAGISIATARDARSHPVRHFTTGNTATPCHFAMLTHNRRDPRLHLTILKEATPAPIQSSACNREPLKNVLEC